MALKDAFTPTLAAVLEFLEPSRCLVCWRALRASKYNNSAAILRELRTGRLCRACRPERLSFLNCCILCQYLCHEIVAPDTKMVSICRMCQLRPLPFDMVRSYALYQGRLRPLIHAMKYHRNAQLARHLGELMGDAITDLFGSHSARWDLIIPVPPSATNLRKRGFNQAAVMARGLLLEQPIRDIFNPIGANYSPRALTSPLARRSAPQITLPPENVGALIGKRILLVDDVLTTGGTATKVAQILLQSGVSAVDLYTFARSTLWLEYRSASLPRITP